MNILRQMIREDVKSELDKLMTGGVSKGKTPEDLDYDELAMGIKVEVEHVKDKDIARKIALDHLTEIPDYYTRLAKMEKEADE